MMVRQPISRRTTIFFGAISIALSLCLYTWLSHRQHQINPDDKSIPTWGQMYDGVAKICTPHPRSREIWLLEDSIATASRLFIALGISVIVALVIGMLGCLAICEAFFAPVLSFKAKIPPTAILAVFFGILPILNKVSPWTEEYNLYIAIIMFGLVPALTERIYLAIRDVPEELIFKSYTLGASHTEVSLSIIFKQILPRIIDALRAQIGPAMVYLIAAEMLCADHGFGYRIRLQSRLVNMDIVYPYIIALAGFGFFMDISLKKAQKWLCPWFQAKGV